MDNRNRITQTMLENLAKRSRRKRLLRRGLALLSVVVLLFTMNTLKLKADTLERIPMCGLQEHQHGPECYAGEEATLVCSLQEHIHTDACYQQRPVKDAEAEEESTDEIDCVSENVDEAIDETEYDLIEAGLEEESAPQDDIEETETHEENGIPTYKLGDKGAVALSKVLDKAGLPVSLDQIEMVGVVDNDDGASGLVSIVKDGDDYTITALGSFDSIELAVVTADDILTVVLTDAVVTDVETEEEQTEVGNYEEPAEEVTEEPTEQEQTEEVTEEQTEEASEEITEEEQTEEVTEEPTEQEQTEEVTEEQTEEVTEESTEQELTEEVTEELAEEEQKAEEPTEEQKAEEPTEEQKAEEPTEEQKAEEPAEEPETEEPVEEQKAEEPVEEQKAEEPVEEQKTEEPVEEQKAEEPVEEQKAEEPVEEQKAEEPVEEQKAEEPVEEPKAEESVEEPKVEEPVEEQKAEKFVEEQKAEEPVEKQKIKKEENVEESTEEPSPSGEGAERSEAEEVVTPVNDDAISETDKEETTSSDSLDGEPASPEGEASEAPEDEQAEEATEETAEDEQTEEATEQPTQDEQTEETTEETAEDEQTEEATEETADEEQTEEATDEEQAEEATEETAEDEQAEEATEETAEDEQAEEATEETAEEEQTEEEQTEETSEEEATEADTTDEAAARIETVYTATIDLAQVESYPLSLRDMMAQAVAASVEEPAAEPAAKDEAEPTEEAAEQTAEEPAEDSVETTETEEQTEVGFELAYDAELLSIEEVEADHLVAPIAAFESTQITVTDGSRYELTLVNYAPVAEEEPEEEPTEAEDEPAEDAEAQAEAVYTATIDLFQVDSYPLSLRAMMAQAVEAPAAESEEPAEQTVEETAEESVEEPAETAEAEEQTGFDIGLEYDAELLSVEKTEDDYLVAPLADFESTEIVVKNGSIYRLTLVNCTLTEECAEEEAAEDEAVEAEPVAMPAQTFEGSTESVKVSVEAPEGAFPEGTTMTVVDVDSADTLQSIEGAVAEDFVEVTRVHAVDITFFNAEGMEIEPQLPINVVMTVAEISHEEEAVVVHVEAEGETEVVEQTTANDTAEAGETGLAVEMPAGEPVDETADAPVEDLNEEADAPIEDMNEEADAPIEVFGDEAPVEETPAVEASEALSFEADSFSVYAVVVTRTIETRYIDAKGETWNISVGYGQEAQLPNGATLSVRELSEAEQAEYYALTADALQERQAITLARFFDISILDADGNEVQPEGPVEVRAELADATEDDVKAVHFAETGMEMIEANRDAEAVCFDAAGFSVYGIVFTVDFRYEVNGKVYEFSLPGGGFVSFTELVEMLGLNGLAPDPEVMVPNSDDVTPDEVNGLEIEIEEEPQVAAPEADGESDILAEDSAAAAREFVADVQNVEFSTPSLVWVGKVNEPTTVGALKKANELVCEYSAKLSQAHIDQIDATQVEGGDWALISLMPFDTNESLTVTMKDGEVFTIQVTDAQIKQTVITSRGEAYEIAVTYWEDAQIPDGAELKVEEILPEDERYLGYYVRSLYKVGAIRTGDSISEDYAHVFDIKIWANEQEVEPAAPVSVSIKLLDAPENEGADLRVVHFGKDSLEVMDIENSEEEKAGETELNFVTDEFSVYTVVNAANGSNLNGQKFALVSGIANDNGATTGWNENWGTDYFTIIVNANAVSNSVVKDSENRDDAISATGVHVWTEDGTTYAGGEAPEWTFVSADNNRYYLSVKDANGNTRYLQRYNKGDNPNGNAWGWEARLVENRQNATPLYIDRNNDGTVLIRHTVNYNYANHNFYLHNDGNGEWSDRSYKFIENGDTNSSAFRFRLCQKSDAFDSFAARKVSAKELTGNDNFIIYRKFVDETTGNEQLYALASDGSFVRVYDGGDTVYWRETDKTIYWNYLMDGNYYSIFSGPSESRVYINPMASTGVTISTEQSRLMLPGKDEEAYSTAIENWDQVSYDYTGLHVTKDDQGGVTLSAGTRAAGTSDEFLFAVASSMPAATAETVATVDSEALGIHITMYDYGDWTKEYNAGDKVTEMSNVVSNSKETAEAYTPHAAHQLVKPYLESGVPSSVTKGAMIALFPSQDVGYSSSYNANNKVTEYAKTGVTNLFLKSYYDENGTFRYRSEDNYAYLGNNGETSFKVYRQAATPYTTDKQPGHSYYYHGHYMPFNDIDMNQHVGRLMNQYGNEYTNGQIVGELPIGDGRTYEEIYGTQGIPNFFTGMKMEANFTQPKNGKLENGDNMIFKFTGDDDMWVYIDGILVLDIGGIHEPLSGTIDFATGKVTNPTGSSLVGEKTLYQIFQNVLNASGTPQSVKDKINAIEWKDADGNGTPDTFADYTNHSFSAFYMERGAGASNLDLQFNLKVTHTNQFSVRKELPEGIDTKYVNQSFKYKATYMDGSQEKPLNVEAVNSKGDRVCLAVFYKDRFDENHQPVPVSVDSNGYFNLKAGEEAVFKMKDETTRYNVKEVEIDDDLIEKVDINGKQVQVVDNTAEAGNKTVVARSLVVFKNYPYTQSLLITKHITKDSMENWESENPVFEFRVYLETMVKEENGEKRKLVPYSYCPYYLYKIVDGEKHYFTLTGVNNAPVDRGTTPIVCSTTGRSGSINSIPPEYTIEILDLVVGTNFYVEERRDNIPEPYEFVREELKPGTYEQQNLYQELPTDITEIIDRVLASDELDAQEFDPNTIGRIKKGANAESHVYNRRPTTNITIKKVDISNLNNEPNDLLKGAAFKITRYTDKTFTSVKTDWGTEGSKTLSDDKQANGTYTLNGQFEFTDIPDGYYVIDEIRLPDGYIKMTGKPRFEVGSDMKVYLLDDNGDRINQTSTAMVRIVSESTEQTTGDRETTDIIVANQPGARLPSTGGMGTTPFTVAGGLLALLALALLLRRREAE